MQIEFYSQFDILFSTCSILVFPRFSNHRRMFQTIQKIQLKEQKKSQRKKEKKEEKYGRTKNLAKTRSKPRNRNPNKRSGKFRLVGTVIGVISRSSGDRVEKRVRSQE